MRQTGDQDFEVFWQHYPRRIGKGAARVAFMRAIKKTTIECILAALEKYKAHKPDHIDYCHPSTWLHQERWLDEWEPPETIKPLAAVRPARSVEEAKAYWASRGSPLNTNAKTVDDLPVFAKMIPNSWNAH